MLGRMRCSCSPLFNRPSFQVVTLWAASRISGWLANNSKSAWLTNNSNFIFQFCWLFFLLALELR